MNHCAHFTNVNTNPTCFLKYKFIIAFFSFLVLHFLLLHNRVLSSKTSCSMSCPMYGHAIKTWSAVCSEAPHLQFGEGARLYLCMDEWNCPTPVRRRLSLTQVVQGKLIPTGLALVLGVKLWILEVFSHYSVFHLWFFLSEARMQVLQDYLKDSAELTQMGVWILVSFRKRLRIHLKTIQDMIRVQRSTLSQGECCSQSAKLAWLDA